MCNLKSELKYTPVHFLYINELANKSISQELVRWLEVGGASRQCQLTLEFKSQYAAVSHSGLVGQLA